MYLHGKELMDQDNQLVGIHHGEDMPVGTWQGEAEGMQLVDSHQEEDIRLADSLGEDNPKVDMLVAGTIQVGGGIQQHTQQDVVVVLCHRDYGSCLPSSFS